MVRDKGKYAVSSLFDSPLSEAYELYIVVVEPLWVAFAKRLSINLKVIPSLLADNLDGILVSAHRPVRADSVPNRSSGHWLG